MGRIGFAVKLHIYRRDTLERTLELTGHDLRLGRGVENDVVLEDADKTVSRFHAELRQEGDEYVLIDLNSQNGTWIEGQRIQRAAVTPGTTIALGHFRLVIEDPTAPPGAPMTPVALGPEEMAPTIMMHAPGAAAAGAAPPAPAAGAPPLPPLPPPVAAAASAAAAAGAPKAVPSRRARLDEQSDPKRRAGAASIPRPFFYGACLVFLTLVIGVMYLLRPQPPPPQPEQPQGNATAGPTGGTESPSVGPESNAQIIARELKDGRTKLDAGDTAGAIEAFTRALLVDPNHPEALDLKMKGEEKRHQDDLAKKAADEAAAKTAGTVSTDKPAGTGTAAITPSTQKPGTGTQATQTQTAPGTTGRTGTRKPPVTSTTAATASVAKQLAAGKSALASGQYRAAIAAFESILVTQPSHPEAATLLVQARSNLKNEAGKLAAQGDALAAQGDLAGALREYERARQIDPGLSAATTGITAVRGKMKGAGDEAFRRGRQLEAVGRLQDAMQQYSRAAELLSADDANGKAARERLDLLKRQP